VLVGVPPSEASDLFAVGVIAHELLVGKHPLGAQPTAALMREFLGTAPIFSEAEQLPVALSAVLRRAMCRAPSGRHADAAAFGRDLARAAGLPVPAETAEIRESFLQAATFVARQKELNSLKQALDDVAAGRGVVWLVGGESGVGKSRLLDELRTLALTRGMHVGRGQAVSTGGSGYQVWQGALRPLCLDANFDELDASVLKAVIPDIAKLLERPVAEPPELDPENAQTRLLIAAEKLLLSQREPHVVLLEDILALLERETSGNAFFIVEVVRALAEEVGTLEKIGSGGIPSHVAAGGVQAVLSRRLGRVPEAARPLLCAAAVFDKELDLAVLHALPEELSGQVEAHIAACADVAVLEVSENRWRFVHDKLRETLLGELTKAERASWHLRIGEAIEKAYAADLDSHAAALGHHFAEADVPARALPYLLQVGDRATPRGSMHEAITHLERAVALFDRVAHTPAERAHALGLLCRAYHGAGKAEESTKIIERMFADAGFPMPTSPWKFFTEMAGMASRHALFRLGWYSYPALTTEEIALHEEASDCFIATAEAIVEIYSPAQLTCLLLTQVPVGERLGDPARMAVGNASLGAILSLISIRGLSDSHFRRAREWSAQNLDLPLEMQASVTMDEGITRAFQGEWEAAGRAFFEELAVCPPRTVHP